MTRKFSDFADASSLVPFDFAAILIERGQSMRRNRAIDRVVRDSFELPVTADQRREIVSFAIAVLVELGDGRVSFEDEEVARAADGVA